MTTLASNTSKPTVLWWSRSGRNYSRDRIVRIAFRNLGWTIEDFKPAFSGVADKEASMRRLRTPDLTWVPCFRQRDAAAAIRWSRRRGVPVAFDPLISAWDKQVFERQKLEEDSPAALKLRAWEASLFRECDVLVADTDCHADFFCETHGVDRSRIAVVPVSAEEEFFSAQSAAPSSSRLHVMFYGSFIGLQGPQFIARAASQLADVKWTFIGSGPLLDECKSITQGCHNVEYISRVPYEELSKQIGEADVLLGVFGTSAKAGRVIPNKVYQALACGRPVITRHSAAYPTELTQSTATGSGILWVNPGDAEDLVETVRSLASTREQLPTMGAAARATFFRFFDNSVVESSLTNILHAANADRRAA